MYVVSLLLPGLRALRLSDPPHPATIEELYREVEDLLEDLHASPASPEELRGDSSHLKRRLIELVDGLELELSPKKAREFTLAALAGGMFAGALDGTLLYSHSERTEQPALRSSLAYLQRSSGVLWENLSRVLEVGESSWRHAHVDDLQLLSGYGKHENRHSMDEGEELEAQTRDDRSQFQAFLLASFKGGYAMGVVDSAVMFVGGERPGAPPSIPREGTP
jgi:hypothetical protein